MFLLSHRSQVILLVFSIFLGSFSISFAQENPPVAKNQKELVAEWQKLGYGMFLHFGMSTFSGIELDPGDQPSTTYAPTALDVDQWIRVARDAGMKYAVLTSKHVAGHCLWDSKVPFRGKEFDYDVATSSDKTDVIAEFMAACKKYGIRPGLYWCFWDNHNNSIPSEKQRVIKEFNEEFLQFTKDQLTELLTNYPGLNYLWLDIPGFASAAQRQEIYDTIKKVNPNCVVLYNQGFIQYKRTKKNKRRLSIRSIQSSWPTDILNSERWPEGFQAPDDWFVTPQTYKGKTYHLGYEHCDTICKRWFWKEGDQAKSTEVLYDVYKQVTDAGGNLLLNVPPDRSGRIPDYHIKALMELKKAIDDPSTLKTSK